MSDNIVHVPVNLDYAKRGDPTTLAFMRQSAERSTNKVAEIMSKPPFSDSKDFDYVELRKAWADFVRSCIRDEAKSASRTERTCENSESPSF